MGTVILPSHSSMNLGMIAGLCDNTTVQITMLSMTCTKLRHVIFLLQFGVNTMVGNQISYHWAKAYKPWPYFHRDLPGAIDITYVETVCQTTPSKC